MGVSIVLTGSAMGGLPGVGNPGAAIGQGMSFDQGIEVPDLAWCFANDDRVVLLRNNSDTA